MKQSRSHSPSSIITTIALTAALFIAIINKSPFKSPFLIAGTNYPFDSVSLTGEAGISPNFSVNNISDPDIGTNALIRDVRNAIRADFDQYAFLNWTSFDSVTYKEGDFSNEGAFDSVVGCHIWSSDTQSGQIYLDRHALSDDDGNKLIAHESFHALLETTSAEDGRIYYEGLVEYYACATCPDSMCCSYQWSTVLASLVHIKHDREKILLAAMTDTYPELIEQDLGRPGALRQAFADYKNDSISNDSFDTDFMKDLVVEYANLEEVKSEEIVYEHYPFLYETE